ncbi:hypothetical protein RXV94_03290 [Yeosuana sp. MJ-SS3]|jgi:hypothetical protein|uniref:LPXTG cell wall anchor domain-containing protein n=1 Tax=Gilvirhabdus luticola TaxID=3079858 RepID=A0ABU3U430_9FLAO|nr:hypothetical protein [Yeosuana sp. MJ-SS3]MDU8885170.1 hypothetical protein [Yeosuana sp. MJ-SS3]
MKFFQYAYLIFAILFVYDAIQKWFSEGVIAYMSILLAATAIFMFFFRRKFNKKFENKE